MTDLDLTEVEVSALNVARDLARAGVPIFVAEPNPEADSGRAFLEPKDWQNTVADPTVVDRWRPGMMLAAVTGVLLDVVDTDPRNGGDESRAVVEKLMPPVYGVVRTPRGGTHEYVHRLNRPKRAGSSAPLPGLDVLAGDDGGQGRGYVRIPPTATAHGLYTWERQLDLPGLGESSQAEVADFVTTVYDAALTLRADQPDRVTVYDGHRLSDRERAYLDAVLQGEVEQVAQTPEGGRNARLNLAAYRVGRFVTGAGLDRAVAAGLLQQAAEEAGLPQDEAALTIRSGLLAGSMRGRAVPVGGAAPNADSGADLVDLGRLLREGPIEPERTTVLHRSDGLALFYAGRINALIGEPESGKTWIATAAVADVVAAGGRCLYVDLEDTARSFLERMNRHQCDPADLVERVQYSRPSTAEQLRHRLEWAATAGYDLVVIDSMGELLSMLGVDSISNDQVVRTIRQQLRPIADSGAAVVTIDHVTKNREGRGRYAIGAQAKLATLDGVAYLVETVTPGGQGRAGCYRLKTAKDRPGWIRGQGSGDFFAEAYLDENADQFLTLKPVTHRAGVAGELAERVLDFLQNQTEPVSMNKIEKGVSGNTEAKREVVHALVDSGDVKEITSGPHTTFILPARQGEAA